MGAAGGKVKSPGKYKSMADFWVTAGAGQKMAFLILKKKKFRGKKKITLT